MSADDSCWTRYTLTQDTYSIIVSGKGFTIFPSNLPFRAGKANLKTESFLLASPFSLDINSRLPETNETIVLDRKYQTDNKVGAKAQLWRKNILVQFTIPEGRNVRSDWYVTFPNGSVEKYEVPKTLVRSGAFIQNTKKIQLSLPARTTGTYLIETVDESGVAYFNIPVRVGMVWNVLDPISPEMRSQVRKNLKLIKINSIQALNKLRASQDQNLIVEDTVLTEVAQSKAEDMAKRGYLGHVNPEGKRIGDLLIDANIPYTSVGENIAGGSKIIGSDTSPISDIILTDGLELSGSHRYNMLRPDWTKVGIGYATANGKSYYVQIFGK